MTDVDSAPDLLAQAATGENISLEVLKQLLALESAFPDFNVYGAKTDFHRCVAEILDQAARDGSAG